MKRILTRNNLRQPIGIFLNESLPILMHTASENIRSYVSKHGLPTLRGNGPVTSHFLNNTKQMFSVQL